MMYIKTKVLNLILLIVVAYSATIASSNAEYQKSCKISYVNTGKTYDVVCHFLSGSELNDKTMSFDYDTFETYAVIFWGDNKATVIKIDDFIVCGLTVEFDCTNSILPLDGTDKQGRKWKICNQSDLFCS